MNLDELEAYVHETRRQLDDLEASLSERRQVLMYIEATLDRMEPRSRRGVASWSGKAGEYAKRTVTEATA